MKALKNILATVVSLALVFACLPSFSAFAENYSGTCGENVTWSLDTETGVLTISGSGDMDDYNSHSASWDLQDNYITSVIIENGVTSIGYNAFKDCINLTSVTIPDSVTSIDDYAFSGCSSLSSVTIPDSVTSIGNSAFFKCSDLISVTIGNGVTSIGDAAFSACSSLTSVTIPNSVTSIGARAFAYCSKLTAVTIPNSVTSIGGDAFDLTAFYKNEANWEDGVLYCGNYLIDAKNTLSGDYTIKAGTKVLADSAFSGCNSLTSVTILDGVTSIGVAAFSGCGSLTSVTIPNFVTNIGARAFYDCECLTSVTIPNSVTSIGDWAFGGTAFYDNTANWKDGVLYCGNYLIDAKYNLSGDYAIKAETKVVADSAFSGCYSLTSVTIPDSVINIGGYAFYDCSSLTSVTIPDSVTSIGARAFYNCRSLTSVTIPNGVTSIGYETFDGCSSLTSVTIPNSVTSIGDLAFYGCSSLTSVTIPNSVTSIGDFAFYGCCSLTSVIIPGSVTSIGNSAFFGCSSLTSVTIGNGVTSIGYETFAGCSSLTSVIIPNSVTSIGYGAFRYCNSLKDVWYEGIQNDKGNISFRSDNEDLASATWHYNTCNKHSYDNDCDKDCNVCGYIRTVPDHVYDNSCDTTCNICGTVRTVKHANETTLINATLSKNGSIVKKCSLCDKTESTTVIYSPKIFKLSATSYTYNGGYKKPTVTVKDSKDKTLKNGTDYTVSYKNNKNVGTATATVTFKGNYSGTKNLNFTIQPKTVSKICVSQTTSSIKAYWSKVSTAKDYKVYLYKGSKLVSSKTLSGSTTNYTFKKLSSGTDYTVKVRVGSVNNYWSVTKSLATATKTAAPKISKAEAGKKSVTLYWKDVSGESGYQVYYATSKNGSYKKVATLKANSKKVRVKKLKSKKTYYFKVRAYKKTSSGTVYSNFGKVKTAKVK